MHPESLTTQEIGSLVQSAAPSFIVEALKHQNTIYEYTHCMFGEPRYIFPAYFLQSPPKWVCTNCSECRVVAGRWLEIKTEIAARNFLLQLMMKTLSSESFSDSAIVDGNAAYFITPGKVQLGIRYIDHFHSSGVMIQVCSYASSPKIVPKCRSLLDFVVALAYALKPDVGPVAVVSSRDLSAGRKIPYLFSRSEISQAQASHKSFLSNPARLHAAETFTDLLLSDPSLSPVISSSL